ncbi:uncharacterized protein DEA37_0007623 [Paragonimus westermani]|uniref:Uncharacterized protein n=1 Tax=Paragonimus westermani TaxID=34504 RepID=A0A5J4NSS3_9TREM|nr:uncharacterized protein DEA37_0007623 [Paragonimus westermani]
MELMCSVVIPLIYKYHVWILESFLSKKKELHKMTVNPRIAAQHGGKPPPFYVCLDCADALNRRDFDQLVDILLPSKQVGHVTYTLSSSDSYG